jgi:hypothetical protein
VLPLVARRALRVVTVSEFSRRELEELLGVQAVVVPGGVDARFVPGLPSPVAGRYVLTVASRTARKNLGALEGRGAAVGARGDRAGRRGWGTGRSSGTRVRGRGALPGARRRR